VCGSFLDADPQDKRYRDVEYILLDPSCSGSGIVGRFDELVDQMHYSSEQADATDDATAKDRLQSLADFQLSVIQHAFKFPKVMRVVYSTCSIHEEENEQVVAAALKSSRDFVLTKALPQWPRRGSSHFPGADNLVRTVPKEDRLIGFFVACFERQGGKVAAPVASVSVFSDAPILGGGESSDSDSDADAVAANADADQRPKKRKRNKNKRAKAKSRKVVAAAAATE